MQARPTQRDFFRWGGLAAVLAGALGIVLNLLHPRTTENVGNVRSHLEMIAGSDVWKLDHAGLAIAVGIGLLGVIAIALSMAGTGGDLWARAWLTFTVGASAVLLVFLAVDGSAIKGVADRWASGGDDPGSFAAAAGIEGLAGSLFALSVFLYFGIAPLLLGMAVLTSGVYPKALAQVSMTAGALGIITALLMWIQGTTLLNSVFLFSIASLLATITLIWAGWAQWKSNGALGATAPTTTRTDPPVTPGL
jgi:hypothetical protein